MPAGVENPQRSRKNGENPGKENEVTNQKKTGILKKKKSPGKLRQSHWARGVGGLREKRGRPPKQGKV